ncbi:hypothetical protein [Galbibacter sp.]|uniref:hypothetical protein n=1 Tax=Galbibacter sp. TaxID=2918471 RepID=UPI003A8D4CDC
MITGINWKDYLITVVLLLVAYYAAVLCWFYLYRLKVPLKSKAGAPVLKLRTLTHKKSENLPNDVETVLSLLKENIAQCFYKGLNREQLLKCIAKILCTYPSLRNTSFREHINQSIVNECNKYGPVGLRHDELEGLWKATTLHTVP